MKIWLITKRKKMEDIIGCKNDEYTDDEEMFKPRKRRCFGIQDFALGKTNVFNRKVHPKWYVSILYGQIDF